MNADECTIQTWNPPDTITPEEWWAALDVLLQHYEAVCITGRCDHRRLSGCETGEWHQRLKQRGYSMHAQADRDAAYITWTARTGTPRVEQWSNQIEAALLFFHEHKAQGHDVRCYPAQDMAQVQPAMAWVSKVVCRTCLMKNGAGGAMIKDFRAVGPDPKYQCFCLITVEFEDVRPVRKERTPVT